VERGTRWYERSMSRCRLVVKPVPLARRNASGGHSRAVWTAANVLTLASTITNCVIGDRRPEHERGMSGNQRMSLYPRKETVGTNPVTESTSKLSL